MNDPGKVVTDYSDLDVNFLTRELDRAKSQLFSHKYAAFYGPLLCSLNFFWTPDMRTAATDGVNLMWNPYWFLKLSPKSRVTVLFHEIKHPALLHFHRQGERNAKIWNYATDIKINNELEDDGFSFEELKWCWKDQTYRGMVEEDIYDALITAGTAPQHGAWGQFHPQAGSSTTDPQGQGQSQFPDDGTDMFPNGPMSKEDMAQAVNNAIMAQQQAKLAGAGQMPGDIEALLTQFLAPIVPWEQYLHRFMQELAENGFTWSRPNRRFADIYLPSRYEDEGALDHLIYFEDTSGSISDKDALRFNSEFKYVKDHYKPKKMTLVQFDTIIQSEQVYTEEDPFDQVMIKGRGGTDLTPVREYILKHRPTAAIVFSDMQCAPMEPLGFEIPILWVVISNRGAKVPFGQVIHIR